MPGKSTFQDVWLNPLLYSHWHKWLRKGRDKWKATCVICSKEFDVSNMGIGAIRCHEKGRKHKERVNAATNTRPLQGLHCESISTTDVVTVQSCKSAKAEQEVPVVKEKIQPTNTCTVDVRNTMGRFLIKDEVTRAEVLWALNVVMCHMSSRSGEKCSDIFPHMFGDSVIASQFKMKKDKLAYTISYGLGPYFQCQLANVLQRCDYFVVMFDKSLNKVAQKGQMDIVIRYWNHEKSEVASRYLTSAFLGRATAKHLFEAFTSALEEHQLSLKKILQISMDGPSVNIKLLSDIKEFMKEENSDDPTLMDIGTCSLHIIHGAFKMAHNKCDWSVHLFLRCLFFLFKDFPSRRAQYTDVTGSSLFPRKFCAIRWIENSAVAERAINMLPYLKEYVKNVVNPPNSANFRKMKEFVMDKLLEARLGFFQSIAQELEIFLTRYQSNEPLLPFLYSDFYFLLRSLMCRFIKKTVMEQVTNPSKLCKVDVKNKENWATLETIEIGFPALKGCKRLEKLDIMTLRKECQAFLIAMCIKLLEKSPLKYKLVQGATCFNPEVMLSSTLQDGRITSALRVFVENKRISAADADAVKREYLQLCQSASVKVRLRQFVRQKDRLDNFLLNVLNDEHSGKSLVNFCKQVLILSHGNAAVERSFSVNKECLVENLKESSLIAQRVIHDTVMAAGGICKIEITKAIIQAVRNASGKRRDALKAQQESATKDVNKRKRAAEELRDLQDKKKLLLLQKDEEIDSLNKQMENIKKIMKP